MCIPEPSAAKIEPAVTVADILRKRRLELGLSRAELARYVAPNCQPSDIDVLESHRMLMPSWIRLKQLADALEVPVGDLLPSDEERVSDSPGSAASQGMPSANP